MEVEAESIKKKNLREFQDLLNEDLKKRILKENSIIDARITEITPKWVHLDVQGKSDGIISGSEFDNLSSLKVGDTIKVLLERIEDYRSGQIVLSRHKAILLQNWEKLVEAYKKEEIVTGVIKSRTRGGYLTVVAGSNCFLPASAVSDSPKSSEEIQKLFNVESKMRVVGINEQRMNCIVSIKEVHAADKKRQLDLILKKIKVGDILTEADGFELRVAALNDWASFLTISIDGASAISMCHITQMAFERLRKPSDIMSIGQKIPKIKVLDIDKNTNPPRIALSLKSVLPDPFEKIEKRYLVNKFYPSKVVRIVTYGAFVELEPKIQCLLHTSQIDAFSKNVDPSTRLSLGQNIKVRILKIYENKISVSLIPEVHPFDSFMKSFSEGDTVQCEVVAILDFGITLKIEGSEIIGFSHWKNLSYNPESEENLKKWKKAMKTPAKILEINKEKLKVRLGIREASGEKDPFMNCFGARENNQIITCTVRDVLKNAIKVSPGEEKNLLITIKKSHLAKNLEDCRPEIFRRGDIISAQIINLKKSLRKVDLSIKEKEKSEETKLIKKFGKDGSSSGKVLKDILGRVFSSKKDEKDKK
jgi:small subunit ribosomal protein S1